MEPRVPHCTKEWQSFRVKQRVRLCLAKKNLQRVEILQILQRNPTVAKAHTEKPKLHRGVLRLEVLQWATVFACSCVLGSFKRQSGLLPVYWQSKSAVHMIAMWNAKGHTAVTRVWAFIWLRKCAFTWPWVRALHSGMNIGFTAKTVCAEKIQVRMVQFLRVKTEPVWTTFNIMFTFAS